LPETSTSDREPAGPEPAEAKPSPGGKPAARRTLVVVGMCVVLAALWASGIFLFVKHRSTVNESARHDAALTAARAVATDLTSISGDTAPATIDKLKQETTGGFRDQISSYAAAAQAMLQQSNAGSRGTVTAAGIESGDGDKASALVTVTAIVSNNKLPSAQPLSYRLAIQLQHEGDRWLASDITFIQ
jgi:Mce-associated membrane protein